MKIVTFNLRYEWQGADGANAFIHRAGFIYDKIVKERPSVIGFQEVVPQALTLLRRMLTEYEFFGGMRTERHDGEGVYFAFLREDLVALGGDVFWLSPTPYLPGSRFAEQSKLPRVGVYLRLAARASGEIYHLFNLHLDYISEEAARLGLTAALDYIASRGACIDRDRTVILGDFNVTPESPALAPLAACAWLADATADLGGSFHDFDRRKNAAGEREDVKIDYIFLSRALLARAAGASLWRDEDGGIYLSDHYPIALLLGD